MPNSLYQDRKKLVEEGAKFTLDEILPVSECKELLSKQVFGLRTKGSTALGPALSAAVGLASQCVGSEVILCTDGLPNAGIGSSNSGTSSFYSDIGEYAKSKGVTISILGIDGADCGARNLAVCADISGGNVNIVNPLELTRQMRMIIDNPAIATEVEVSAFLPKGFAFRGATTMESRNGGSVLVRNIGTITSESDTTFEFGVSTVSKEASEKVLKKHQKIPFQIQIRFTKKDRTKKVRVIQAWLNITKDRELSESNCNISVLGLSAVQQAAKTAQSGDAVRARNNLLSVIKLLQRASKTIIQQEEYSNFISMSEDLDTALLNMQSSKGSSSDATIKTLQRMKTITLVPFLAGSKKEKIVLNRKKHTTKKTETETVK